MTYAEELQRDGVTVVLNDVFNNPACREELLEEAKKFPEFLPGTEQFAIGGFAALGTPSSFHNMTVRKFREWAMAIVIEKVFSEVIAGKRGDWKLEQKIERMTIRQPGETPSAESWHRDEAKIMTTPDDVVYGGWINLDDTPQIFSCVIGSHRTGVTSNGGFVKVSKEEANQIKSQKLSTKIRIPPGAILIFQENVIHEVLARKLQHRMVRLHTAWRITPGGAKIDDLFQRLESQAIIPIKSGQIPPMHAKLHWCNWTRKLQKWSLYNLKKRCLQVRTIVSKKSKLRGKSFIVAKEHMDSLEELGFPKYPKYSKVEKNMLVPRKSWILLVPGKKRIRKNYHL